MVWPRKCIRDASFTVDLEGNVNKFGMLQYMFEGPEVDIKVKPHGNSKMATPYFRTTKKTKERIRTLAATSTPKHVVQTITREQGGEIEAKGPTFLPRDRQQVANFRRSIAKPKDNDVLYSIMMECKLSQGKGDMFVQDVKAAPEPQSVLFYDWQIDDLVRFCTNNSDFSILTVDTTFNLGDFFVTPTTYHHLMLEDIRTGKHPIMLGPILVHQRTQFATFNYFASTLVGYNKSLRNVLAIGTDGDANLTEALGHSFPFALQLRCFLHFKRNIQEKLRDLAIPKHVAQAILDDIFGKREGNVKIEGLVDVTSVEDFDRKLDALEKLWNALESPHTSHAGSQFFSYFKRSAADVIRHHMRKDLREAAGLGSPPAIFTTNSSEAMNSVIKKQVAYKKTQWPEFVREMKELVDSQRSEIIRALSGRGRYRLTENYQRLGVSLDEWNKMRSDQRKKIVERLSSAQLTAPMCPHPRTAQPAHVSRVDPAHSSAAALSEFHSEACSSTSSSTQQPPHSMKGLDVSAEDSGIHTIPLITLQAIWSKATSLLQSDTAITPAPGTDKRVRCVMSYRSDTPHVVRPKGSSQYVCDANCPQWVSGNICAHTVAVAQLNNSLRKFLDWYASSAVQPNLTTLAMTGMPPGRGRKGNKAPRSRKVTRTASPDTIVPSPHSLSCLSPALHPAEPQPSVCPTMYPAVPQPSVSPTMHPAVPQPSVSPTMHPAVPQPSVSSTTDPAVSHPPATQPSVLPTATFATQPPLPMVFVGQSNNSTFNGTIGSCSVQPFPTHVQQPLAPSTMYTDSPFQPSHILPANPNPFYVKFITGNIRTCQGCRGTLRTADGSIPTPPYDLAIARAERRQFRDSSGTLITPRKETAAHYHCRLECVIAVEPNFAPLSLNVPSDVYSRLSPVHRQYLYGAFGLSL